jgi:hypothetical protein
MNLVRRTNFHYDALTLENEREVWMTTMDTNNTPRPTPVNRTLALSVAVLAGAFAIVWRLLPWHPWNMTPVGSLSLFGGARLRRWQAVLLPMAVMVVSDVLLWKLYGWEPFNPWVYGSFLINVLLGAALIRFGTLWCMGVGSVLGSLQFFLLTNFGMWTSPHSMYPQTLTGLVDCYIMGLPFFGATLLGDLGFSMVLFGAYALLAKKVFVGEEARLETAIR